MICHCPALSFSMFHLALSLNPPLPVLWDSSIDSFSSTRIPPVGKSGPLTKLEIVLSDALGNFIKCNKASDNSEILWGGIYVAIPTAIPCEPFANKFGKADGKTTGSSPSSS